MFGKCKRIMGNLKYVEENLKTDDLSGIITHFSLAIFSYSFAGKEMVLISVYVFPGRYNGVRKRQVGSGYIAENDYNDFHYRLCM